MGKSDARTSIFIFEMRPFPSAAEHTRQRRRVLAPRLAESSAVWDSGVCAGLRRPPPATFASVTAPLVLVVARPRAYSSARVARPGRRSNKPPLLWRMSPVVGPSATCRSGRMSGLRENRPGLGIRPCRATRDQRRKRLEHICPPAICRAKPQASRQARYPRLSVRANQRFICCNGNSIVPH